MKELREYIKILEQIEAEQFAQPIQESETDLAQLSDILDEIEEHLNHAVGLSMDLARLGRDVPGPFSGQIRAYLEPHLEGFISDRRQPGSIPSLREMLIDAGNEDEDDDEQL